MDSIRTTIEEPTTQASLLEKISFILLVIFIGIVPLFVLPQQFLGFLYSKIGLATYAILLTFVATIITIIQQGSITLLPKKILAAVGAVPLITGISALASSNVFGGILGIGSDFDTAYFVFLGCLLFVLTAFIFKTKPRIFTAYLAFFGGFIVAALIHSIRFVMGPGALSLQSFLPNIASNTIGSWSDFGAYTGLVVILSFITLEFVVLSKVYKIALSIVLAFSLGLLAITNFATVSVAGAFTLSGTAIVGVVALFVFVYIVSLNYKKRTRKSTKDSLDDSAPRGIARLPVASLIVLIVSVICTIAMQPITTVMYKAIGINPADVLDARPNLVVTMNVAGQVIQSGFKNAILGIGPNQFYKAWALYKPQSINQTVFWNTDFNFGSGYIPTSLITTGIFGFISWLVLILGAAYFGLRGVFMGTKDKFSQYLMLSSLLAAGYLWFIAFFTLSGPVVLLLAFFFTGLLFASLSRERMIETQVYSWTSSQKKGFIVVFISILVLIASIALGFGWTKHAMAAAYMNKAVAAIQSDKFDQAEPLIAKAIQSDRQDVYLRTFAQFRLIQVQQALQSESATTLSKENSAYIEEAIAGAREAAVNLNPSNYQNWVLLGSVYEKAALLGVEGAGAFAKTSYEQSGILNPVSPLAQVLLAQLYLYAKDTTAASEQLELALKKKPDFTEAQTLLNKIKQSSAVAPTPSKSAATSTESSSTATTTKKKAE